MKKVLALIIALMFAFSVTAVFAAETQKSAAPAKKDDAKKATVTGEVIAINAKANTLTVKGPRKGNVALTANDKTKIMAGKDKKTLADVKAGDKVAVKYTETDGKNTANKINIKTVSAKMAAPAPAAAPKAEEKKAPAKKKTAGY